MPATTFPQYPAPQSLKISRMDVFVGAAKRPMKVTMQHFRWLVLVFLVSSNLDAQVVLPTQGYRSLELMIGGHAVACTSGGRPVAWVADYTLADVGFTRPSALAFGGAAAVEIAYNPTTVLNQPEHLALFWLGHECGHAFNQTSNESEADCWSAKTGVQHGWFTPHDFDRLKIDMRTNPGDSTHPPGPERMDNSAKCLGLNIKQDGPSSDDSSVESDKNANRCEAEYRSCLADVRTVNQCLQDDYPDECIKSCTEQDHSYNDCRNRLCLATEFNVNGWQKTCSRKRNEARDKCSAQRDECTQRD
jgi:hypothetical protein